MRQAPRDAGSRTVTAHRELTVPNEPRRMGVHSTAVIERHSYRCYALQIETGYTGYPTRVLWVLYRLSGNRVLCSSMGSDRKRTLQSTLSSVLYYGPLVGLWSTVRSLLSGCNVRALLSGSK